MDILKEEKIVDRILSKMTQLCGIDTTPVKVFSNPLSVAKKSRILPLHGFIAGGAISNTILSLMDGKDYPINDIDIFYETDENSSQDSSNRTDKINLFSGGYGELIAIDSRSDSYSIVTTEREDIINNVYVRRSSSPIIGDDNLLFILKGFDINCCMVGIDIETNRLVYTKDFEDFLKHRQLMVINPYTPCHTSMRLLKKKDELNCYLDVDKEMKYLSQVFLMFIDPYAKGMKKVFANFFSEKYKQLYEKYSEQLSTYFDLLSFIEAKTLSYKTINSTIFDAFDDISISKHLIMEWSKSELSTLKPKKYNKVEKYVENIPHSVRGPISLKKVWNIFERSNKTEIKKAEMILNNPEIAPFFFAIDGFHKCDFNEKNIDDFIKVFGKNQILIDAITKSNLNLQESLNFIRMIKTISTKESALFVDIIVERIVQEYGSIDKERLMDKEFIKTIFEQEKNMRSKLLVQPLDLGEFEYNMNVYELVTEYDLLFASRILHNCMAQPNQDYQGRIKSGGIKLFLIETENNYSGVEMEYNLLGFKLRTVLGVTNKTPCDKHVYLSNFLVSFLNHRHWLLKSNDILDKLQKGMVILNEKVKNSVDTNTSDININMVNRLAMNDFAFGLEDMMNVNQPNRLINEEPPPFLDLNEPPPQYDELTNFDYNTLPF
jgi:hypothetical protein